MSGPNLERLTIGILISIIFILVSEIVVVLAVYYFFGLEGLMLAAAAYIAFVVTILWYWRWHLPELPNHP